LAPEIALNDNKTFHGGKFMHNHGFTLLELLVTLVIIVLLMTIGLPSFSAQVQNTRLKTATQQLFEAVQLTRTKAVSTNKRATLKHLGKWEDGWEVFADDNNNGERDKDEQLLITTEALRDVRITVNQPLKKYISFIGTGESRYASNTSDGGFQAGTMKICSLTKDEGYELVLARSGRMRMNPTKAEDCK
jgi:type IV fimbrial biogenesis protein FimT